MERYTSSEAAEMLGISEEQLDTALRDHQHELPDFDPESPEVPQDAIEALSSILSSGVPPDHDGDRASGGDPTGAKIVAVTSGKGGVGKTSLTVNLAAEFSSRGLRTIIIDVDLGLSNAHILAGMAAGKTLTDYLDGSAALAEIIMDGPAGVKLISGGSGVREMANLDQGGRDRILEAIEKLRPHCDVILLDTGAGISNAVTDFVSISDHTIVVTTSNFAAIADAYGIIKILVQDGLKGTMHLIINRVRSPEEAEQVYKKLQGCTERFLSFELNWLGLLPEDNSVEGAVLKRAPFCEAFPASVATRYLKKLATAMERYLQPAATGAD